MLVRRAVLVFLAAVEDELSETARALAWSPETPEEEDVEEISERAGIHRRNGEGEL